MLAWSDVKPIARDVLARPFTDLGFGEPARAMWRYRPAFVDVVWFEAPTPGLISVEFGCTPRIGAISNPKPWDCRFRVIPTVDLGVDANLLMFADDSAQQRQRLSLVAPQLIAAARRWFIKFESVATAASALRGNAIRGENHVSDAQPGSPAYQRTMRELAELGSKSV